MRRSGVDPSALCDKEWGSPFLFIYQKRLIFYSFIFGVSRMLLRLLEKPWKISSKGVSDLGQKIYEEEKRIYIYIVCHLYTSLRIHTSPSSYEAGRPPPRGRPESLRVMTGRPPPRGRSEGQGPWCQGSLGRRVGKNQNLDNFLRKGTRVNRRAALIRRLSESPVRRFAGIAGALDNDNPSVRRGGQRPSGTTQRYH